jgi:hypothetical protein
MDTKPDSNTYWIAPLYLVCNIRSYELEQLEFSEYTKSDSFMYIKFVATHVCLLVSW